MVTIVWLLSTVYPQVPLHAACLSALIVALCAFVRFFSSVTAHVNLETAACNAGVIAVAAFVWTLARVYTAVPLQVARGFAEVAALATEGLFLFVHLDHVFPYQLDLLG